MKEYYSKCNVCGKISCYNDADIKNNNRQALVSGLSALGSMANAIGGTRYDMYEMNKMSDRANSKIVDYSKCPECGSKDTVLVTKKFAIFSNKLKGNYSIDDLLTETNKYLTSGDFENAFCFATMILTEDENNYNAYLVRFLSSINIKKIDELNNLDYDLSNNQHFVNLLNHSTEKQKEKLIFLDKKCKLNMILCESKELLNKDDDFSLIENLDNAINKINSLDIENSNAKIISSLIIKKQQIIYAKANEYSNSNSIDDVKKAIDMYNSIKDYKDSQNRILKCKANITEIKKQIEIDKTQAKKNAKKTGIFFLIITSILILLLVVINVIIPNIKYSKAEKLFNSGDYSSAIKVYEEIVNYKDSKDKIITSKKSLSIQLYKKGNLNEAFKILKEIENSLELDEEIKEIYYSYAISIRQDDYKNSLIILNKVLPYKDAKNIINEIEYSYVKEHYDINDSETYNYLNNLKNDNYLDASELYGQLYKKHAEIIINTHEKTTEPENSYKYSAGNCLWAHYKVSGLYPNENLKLTLRCKAENYYSSNQYNLNRDVEIVISKNDEWDQKCLSMAKNVQCSLYNGNSSNSDLLATSNYAEKK